MGRLFLFYSLALWFRRCRCERFVGGVEVPVIQRNPEPHGVVGTVEVPRIHVDADGAVLCRILARRRSRGYAVVKRDLTRIGVEFNLDPCGVSPFLVLAFEVLVEFARGAERRQGICLSESDVAVAIRKSDYQFPTASCAEVERLELDDGLIGKVWFGQTSSQWQKRSDQSDVHGRLSKVRCNFHRFDWHQS